jgi:hypothetical protein
MNFKKYYTYNKEITKMEATKITTEDYLEALEIVKAYHQQIKDEIEYVRVREV